MGLVLNDWRAIDNQNISGVSGAQDV